MNLTPFRSRSGRLVHQAISVQRAEDHVCSRHGLVVTAWFGASEVVRIVRAHNDKDAIKAGCDARTAKLPHSHPLRSSSAGNETA